MKKIGTLFLAASFIAVSCGKIKEKTKEGINKSGETIGKTATEFVSGVSEGVEKTLVSEISLSGNLKKEGIRTGKISVTNSPQGGTNNVLTVYLIFDKDFKSVIAAKVFDNDGLEIGRARLAIENTAGNAGYYDFVFDKRTHIETKSKVELE